MRALVLSVVRKFIKPLIIKAIDEAVEVVGREVAETGKLSDDGNAQVQSALEAAANEVKTRLNVL